MSLFCSFLMVPQFPRTTQLLAGAAEDAPREEKIAKLMAASERLMPDLLNRIRNWRLLGTEKTRSEALTYVVEDESVPGEIFQLRYYPALDVALFFAPAAVFQSVERDAQVRNVVAYEEKQFRIPDSPVGPAAPPEAPWYHACLNLPPIDERRRLSQDVAIGFVDTGIDATHPEFHGRSVVFAEFDAAGDPVFPPRIGDTRPPHGHGTGVAALAAGNNGVAPAATIVMAMGLPNLNGTPEQVIAAMNWLATAPLSEDKNDTRRGVDFINTSMVLCDGLNNPIYSSIFSRVVARLRFLNIELFAAIGNGGPDGATGSPGNYPQVNAFGAYDRNIVVWQGNSCGEAAEHPGVHKPDFLAPGVNVRTARNGGGDHYMTGTSCSCALGVGVAALMLGAARRLGQTPQYRSEWENRDWRMPIGQGVAHRVRYVPPVP